MGEKVHLVLEGGGAKGVALVGAIAALEEKGYSFDRIAGASVGAIVGSLVAAGFTGKDLLGVVAKGDFEQFLGSPRRRLRRTRALYSLTTHGGIYPMDSLRDWLTGLLAERGVQTFQDLARPEDVSAPAERRFRLAVTVSDLTRGELVYLPWDYHRLYGLDPAGQSVADAVCASAAFPYYFFPQTIKATQRGVAPHLQVGDGTSTVIDGGVTSNFPLDVFEDADTPTVGVKLLPRLPRPEGDRRMLTPRVYWRPLRLAEQMIGTMIAGRDQAHLDHLTRDKRRRVIVVDTSVAGILDFNLKPDQRATLLERGREAVLQFVQGQGEDREDPS
jgi:NTE family protein